MNEVNGSRRKREKKAERRNLLSSFFITLLIGLAYAEMIPPVRDSIEASGFTFGTVVLFIVFFLTSMRFFIGNQLHLLSDVLVQLPGGVWLYDLMVIICQSIAFIFLGGLCSIEAARGGRIGFVDVLAAIYAIDVIWIASQWGLGRIISRWKREFVPWAWAILNSALVMGLFLLRSLCDSYSTQGLVVLLVLNVVGFALDVVLVDYYNAL